MFANADCTFYRCEENGTYTRIQVSGVFWDPGSASSNPRVFIPIEKAELPTCIPTERHYMVRDLIEDEVYDSGMLRRFLERRCPHTVEAIVKRDYGSLEMQHWEVSLA